MNTQINFTFLGYQHTANNFYVKISLSTVYRVFFLLMSNHQQHNQIEEHVGSLYLKAGVFLMELFELAGQ